MSNGYTAGTGEVAGSFLEASHVDLLRSIPGRVQERRMYGMEDVVRILLVALLTGGHVLLEGNPGLGKTALVRALSEALGLGRKATGRIQFTPDLMPADITGTLMPKAGTMGELQFEPGPIFCNLLLADEINRATAKTQSAMLEAMGEYQVTALGERRPLREWRNDRREPYRTPFMVMATQNPIDQEGTYNLPEAQSDRFMFKVRMALPGADVMKSIIRKAFVSENWQEHSASERPEDPVAASDALARLHEVSEAVLSVPLLPLVETHVNNIVQASNGSFDQVEDISPKRMEALQRLVEGRIIYPLGPRAAMAMARAAVAWSAVALVAPGEAAHATPAHAPRALAETVVPSLRHRLRIEHHHEDSATLAGEALAIDDFVGRFAAASAPDKVEGGNYPEDFALHLDHARKTLKF